mmetsp:Transcript_9877/g.21459  ORF Transcript_9877/g.21459 Transcript_9877/m.21459 type:complete len:85 (+) Transcript_9877:1591-1845(+)
MLRGFVECTKQSRGMDHRCNFLFRNAVHVTTKRIVAFDCFNLRPHIPMTHCSKWGPKLTVCLLTAPGKSQLRLVQHRLLAETLV